MERKADKIIWWVMGTSASVMIIVGSAWANSINNKVDKIAALEVNVQYIKSDINDIKGMIKEVIRKNWLTNKGE